MLNGLRVLVAEDSIDNQDLIATYLRIAGAMATACETGDAAVDLALQRDFDVILMDLQMPVMDGHEATRKLRSLEYSKPVIALTAHAREEEKLKCITSGFTDYLTKPIDRKALIDCLRRHCPRAQQ